MNIYRGLSLDEKEAAYSLFRNQNASADLVKGDVVQYALDSVTNSIPGKSVEDAAAASLRVAGVVRGKGIDNADNVPVNDYAVVQVSGYCDFITTDGTIAAGDAMIAGAAVADQGLLGTNDGAFFGVALAADVGTTLSSAILKHNI